jgi:hypothetical protein
MSYQPSLATVLVGPSGGSGQPWPRRPGHPRGVAEAKGRDMMIDRFTELLGVPPAAGRRDAIRPANGAKP